MSKTSRFGRIVLPVACLLLFASGCKASPTKGIEGLWQGTLKVPGGELRIVFHINKTDDGKLSATLDSPDQSANGIPVEECTLKNGKLTLAANTIGGAYEGTMKNDSTIDGTWSQAGIPLPLVLKRIEKVEEALRPQEPKKPYPYKDEEVEFENKAAGIKLAGTLTSPETGGPFPAVVLITGSGPENRDEEVFGHKPFLVLADYLTRQGIAVLRCDDRGVGKSGGDSRTATTADLATDALAAFEYLKTRKEIDPKHIGLLGHSEGGVIAPIVANEAPGVAFVVLMAGTGLPGDSVLMLQSQLVAKAEGAADTTLAKSAVVQRALLNLAKTEPDTAVAAAGTNLVWGVYDAATHDAFATYNDPTAVSPYTVSLTWGKYPLDLDAHFWTPNIEGSSYHVYWQDKGLLSAAPYCELDVDDVTSYGPERITVGSACPGEYTYAVNQYSSDSTISGSGARVELYVQDHLSRTFTVPAGPTNGRTWWHVFKLNGSTGAVTVLNTLEYDPPYSCDGLRAK